MTEVNKQEYIDLFKKEGVKACIKKAKANKNPEEIEFCEELWVTCQFK